MELACVAMIFVPVIVARSLHEHCVDCEVIKREMCTRSVTVLCSDMQRIWPQLFFFLSIYMCSYFSGAPLVWAVLC